MAIEKTTTFINVTALPPGDASDSSDTNVAHPQLMVMEQITLDDTEDDTLPISQQTRRYINRYEEGRSNMIKREMDRMQRNDREENREEREDPGIIYVGMYCVQGAGTSNPADN
mgnify:CR=1 FL=1